MRKLARRALAIAPILLIGGLALAACEDDVTTEPPPFSFDAAGVDFDGTRADVPVSEMPDAADMDAADADTADAADAGAPADAADGADAADAASRCDGGFAFCNAACVPRDGAIDQEQNDTSAGRAYLVRGDSFVQTFTAGASGQLVGIEVYGQRAFVGTGPTQGSIHVTVRRADDVALGAAEIELNQLEIGNSPHQLGAAPGTGYFDLAGECIPITAGQSYELELDLVGVRAGVCTEDSCTSGRLGDTCSFDQDCEYVIGIELTHGDPYPGGELVGFANTDLIFRTYVR